MAGHSSSLCQAELPNPDQISAKVNIWMRGRSDSTTFTL